MAYYMYPDPGYARHAFLRDRETGESFFDFTTDMARRHEKAGNIALAQSWRDSCWHEFQENARRRG